MEQIKEKWNELTQLQKIAVGVGVFVVAAIVVNLF